MASLTIGQTARQAGVGVETIRFYERKGLLDQPSRRMSGYRHYDDEVVARLRFIRRSKELGFTLKEIKELLDLKTEKTSLCDDVKKRTEVKIAEVEAKIHALEHMKEMLVKLAATCGGQRKISECAILDSLDHPSES